MNAERLHAIVLVLHTEMTSSNIVHSFEALCSSLESVINNPSSSDQEDLAKSLETVYASLKSAGTDQFSPAWKQLLSEIGGSDLFGSELKLVVEGIFQRNQITPAVALKELRRVRERLESFQKSLDHIISAFKQFQIGNETLAPGQCEIGVLIPRDAVDNRLCDFARELKDLNFVLNTFSEVATGKTDELSIKTISSSDLTIYLHAAVPFAACLAVAIERIVALYKQLLEIKKIRGDLLKQGVPEKQTAGIEEYANNLMRDGIEELTVEIIEKHHQGKDPHRKNELTTAVKVSLNRIANRIDRGYNIEVRVEPAKAQQTKDEAAQKISEQITVIQTAAKNMQFMKLDGQPILQLPEQVEKPKGKKD